MPCNNFGIVILNLENFANEDIWMERWGLIYLINFNSYNVTDFKEVLYSWLVSFLHYIALDFPLQVFTSFFFVLFALLTPFSGMMKKVWLAAKWLQEAFQICQLGCLAEVVHCAVEL